MQLKREGDNLGKRVKQLDKAKREYKKKEQMMAMVRDSLPSLLAQKTDSQREVDTVTDERKRQKAVVRPTFTITHNRTTPHAM